MPKARPRRLEHEPGMPSKFVSSEFYGRQTVLPELGVTGQGRLRKARVTIVGLGGLGSVSTLFLALGGVGTLRLIDQDTVELNNLHRQVLYDMTDLMYPKVEAAARRIGNINPELKVEPMPENLNSENFHTLLADSDCVVDGLDNMQTRYLINRYCVETMTPFIFGGAIGVEGNVATFKSPDTACLECVLPGLNDAELPTCETRGVLGATAGIVGAIQAMETIKVLAGIEPQSRGRLLIFDFAQSEYRTVDLKIRADCQVCQVKGAQKMSTHKPLSTSTCTKSRRTSRETTRLF
jgi:molybdopterin/thiamine biosynthesis adenylyltransferase